MSKISPWLWAYIALILVGLVLPSDGSHGLLSPKSLIFILASLSTFIFFISSKKTNFKQINLSIFLFCFLSFLWIWLYIGLIQENEKNAVGQFKLFIITVSFIVMTLFYVNSGLINANKILRIIVYGNFTYSLIKVFLVILHLLNLINIWDFIEKTGFRIMTMAIMGGFTRVQTSVDIITPFLLFFVLQNDNLKLGLSKRFRFFYCLVSSFSIFLSFSRFLILVALISYFLYVASLNFEKIVKHVFAFFLTLFLIFSFIGYENTAEIINKRFFHKFVAESDRTRLIQVNAILLEFEQYPFFGKGLGGYSENSIRDIEIPYSYEVQWAAFLMQFGLIGLTFLLFSLAIIFGNFLINKITRIHIGFCLLFLIWLFSGFTNPFLISLTSGITYSIFLLAASILNQNSYKVCNESHSYGNT